ncbi:MAG: aroE3 [Firmicutes bacterium]|nr:aroE3 [Bacillota bacterium]
MESRISGKTRMLGIIGTPVDHSMSPVMYNYSFAKAGIDYAYFAFDIPEVKVPDAIAAIKTFNMRGANVTMPCKTAVVRFMDELSPAARITGAVNTIVNENGRLTGHMTDGVGFVRNLKEHNVDIRDKKITIIGTGGAGTAIQVQCALDGAREISVFNMKDSFFARANETFEKIRKEAPGCVLNIYDLQDADKLREEIATSDILLNATRVGMHPLEGKSVIADTSIFKKDLVVVDCIYNPSRTKLLADAEAAGCKVINGLGMLLWQGAECFNLYTGLEMPTKEVEERFFR